MNMLAHDRAHYDRLLTWFTGVFSRLSGEELAELGNRIKQRSRDAALGPDQKDDDETVFTILSEVGFYAVIDHMIDTINTHEGVGE